MFERFDENFDEYDGGALYVTDYDGDEVYGAAGVLWLDGGYDNLHYFAFVSDFEAGEDMDGIVVSDKYAAADALSHATDPYVSDEIGWFASMAEAVQAVEDHVAMRS